MEKKATAFILSAVWLMLSSLNEGSLAGSRPQQDPLEKNSCVTCHRNITSPIELSHRYYDWHMSIHKDKGVGCDSCHGGESTSNNAKAAHVGMTASLDPSSKSSPKNQAATCGQCHKSVSATFVSSQHYAKLNMAGIGPTCSSCHQHMASSTVRSPNETASLCSTCHNTGGGLMQLRPEIIKNAEETLLALSRARSVITWAERLIEAAQERRLSIVDEQRFLMEAKQTLREVTAGWHDFRLVSVRPKADQAFEMATKVKDRLLSKLYPSKNQ
jgi:hypothetical protein